MLRICLALPLMYAITPVFAQDSGEDGELACPSSWCDDGNPCSRDNCTLLSDGGHLCGSAFEVSLEGSRCGGLEWAVFCSGDGVCGADFGYGRPNSCPSSWCHDDDAESSDECVLANVEGDYWCGRDAGVSSDPGEDEDVATDTGDEGDADTEWPDETGTDAEVAAGVCSSVDGLWDGSVCTVAECDVTSDNVDYAATLCSVDEYWDGTGCLSLDVVEDREPVDGYDDAAFSAGARSVDVTADNRRVCRMAGGVWDFRTRTCSPALVSVVPNCFQSAYCYYTDLNHETGLPIARSGHTSAKYCSDATSPEVDYQAWRAGKSVAYGSSFGPPVAIYFFSRVCESD